MNEPIIEMCQICLEEHRTDHECDEPLELDADSVYMERDRRQIRLLTKEVKELKDQVALLLPKAAANLSKERILEIIHAWKYYWMNQTQNSKQDFDNYRDRSWGIDANMMHDLADLIHNNLLAVYPTKNVVKG